MQTQLQAPPIIEQLTDELYELLTRDNKAYIPIKDVAKLIGMDESCLRQAIYSGNCPFGIGMSREQYRNGFAKVPKLALWNWITKGAYGYFQYFDRVQEVR